MFHARLIGASILVGCLVFACTPTGSSQPIPNSTSQYLGVAFLDPNQFAVDVVERSDRSVTAVRIVTRDGAATRVAFPVDSACAFENWTSPARVRGMLALVHSCAHQPDGSDETSAIILLDPATQSVVRTLPIANLGGTTGISFSFVPDLTKAYYNIGGPVCSYIAIASDGERSARLTASVGSGPKAFTLDRPASLGDCDGSGRATSPMVSPDGSELAFFASPDSVRTPADPTRLKIPWNLYVMNLAQEQITPVTLGITEPGYLRWLPDGEAVVFEGQMSDGSSALWRVALPGGERTPITTTAVQDYDVSPDGSELVGVVVNEPRAGSESSTTGALTLFPMP